MLMRCYWGMGVGHTYAHSTDNISIPHFIEPIMEHDEDVEDIEMSDANNVCPQDGGGSDMEEENTSELELGDREMDGDESDGNMSDKGSDEDDLDDESLEDYTDMYGVRFGLDLSM